MVNIQVDQIYTLRNFQGGTVLDLHGGDKKSIIGYGNNGGSNQAWIFEHRGERWSIKSVSSGKYLGVDGQIRDGTKLVAVSTIFMWDIKDSDVQGIRICVFAHDKEFSVDLSNYGDGTSGTAVHLWSSWPGANQIWTLVPRKMIASPTEQNSRIM
ncbi:carbohydrate-binding module family 13 protein [Suillus paluster]|uniref:carbohydrate-binding module family 13 protein n=1 Tax=Suillus paluster TaxID=48578 RepID=UPI001B860746|nr:carbohydrate-binding module family 13 protein [Suillus paluster]KAG1728377.1 carbohydrate-binding module family 13 protein [Suillus paluster]